MRGLCSFAGTRKLGYIRIPNLAGLKGTNWIALGGLWSQMVLWAVLELSRPELDMWSLACHVRVWESKVTTAPKGHAFFPFVSPDLLRTIKPGNHPTPPPPPARSLSLSLSLSSDTCWNAVYVAKRLAV